MREIMSQTPENTPGSSSALTAKRSSRKSHRKSRNGCDDCKRRRIKCDEQKPACSNCLKHSSRCSFLRHVLPNPVQSSLPTQSSHGPAQIAHLFRRPISPPKSSSPSPFTESRRTPSTVQIPAELTLPAILSSPPNATLNIADLELLHNYDTSTSYTLATIPALQTFLRSNVPRIAFSHSFLLHAILGISALHLAHFKKDIRSHYLNQAQYHYQTALRTTPSPSATSKDTYSALYLFSIFCAFFALGLGPRPGDFLLFGDQGLAEGLVLFRGMKTLLESYPEILEKSDLSPLLGIATRPLLQPSSDNQHLEVLRRLIVEAPSGTANREIYLAALEALTSSFPPSSNSGARSSQTSPQTAFVWMYRLSDEFLACLQRREPIALVILAHFCVLMNDLSLLWCMKGWVDHLLSEIHRSLDEEHRMWMDWPMEEIGWIPGS